jgi:hypothetical protein
MPNIVERWPYFIDISPQTPREISGSNDISLNFHRDFDRSQSLKTIPGLAKSGESTLEDLRAHFVGGE